MDNKKLKSWCDQLIDTGKRTNLTNFKDTKSKTIEIISPDSEEVFTCICNSEQLEIFNAKLVDFDDEDLDGFIHVFGEVVSEDEPDDKAEPFSQNSNQALLIEDKNGASLNDTEKPDKDAEYNRLRDEYITKHEKQRKKRQVLAFNPNGNPITVIRAIEKTAKSLVEETGVNVAYMAFGFIHWNENKNIEYKAPVLLVPITFKNENIVSPFYIQSTEDDVVLNPVMVQKIKTDQGITLPEYHDENLYEYLQKIRDVLSRLGWSVTEECKIGIFSFLKLNMYEDIKNNEAKILANENVKKLLDERIDQLSDNSTQNNVDYHIENELVDIHNVSDADSSQLEAIQMAKAGKSFVLEGPPGTGKSQTITNIIAECLYDGKKVLFVSEKQAALNVVYDRLKKAGLEEFCLELHSYKANKKTFIEELDRTLSMNPQKVSEKAQAEINQKVAAQKKLDEYEKELHSVRDGIGKSLYQLFEAYYTYRKTPYVNYERDDCFDTDEIGANKIATLLGRYSKYVPSIGYDYKKNPWFGYRWFDTSDTSIKEFSKDLNTIIKSIDSIKKITEQLRNSLDVDIDSFEKAEAWSSVFGILSQGDYITPFFFSEKNYKALEKYLSELSKRGMELQALFYELTKEYSPDIFKIDGTQCHKLLARQFQSPFSRMGKEYKKIISDLNLAKKQGGKPSYEEAVSITELLMRYQNGMSEFSPMSEKVKSYLGKDYKGPIETDWKRLEEHVSALGVIYSRKYSTGKLSSLNSDKIAPLFKSIYEKIGNPISEGRAAAERSGQRFLKNDFMTASFDALETRLKGCLDKTDEIENWMGFESVLKDMSEVHIIDFLDLCLANNIRPEDLSNVFLKSFYYYWIKRVMINCDSAISIDRISHDDEVAIFKEKDRLQYIINRATVREKASQIRPKTDMVADGSSVAVLRREAQKKRKQKSIRILMDEVSDLILKIKPCFLMSPLSVSTYLSSSEIHFDTVIFDEASQIFPQDALGAIYRADQVIVAGDQKQMPPTRFFQAMIDDDAIDDESSDVTDFESVLDICKGIMDTVSLSWHYRSRYEQLISYSNWNFYNGNLITFPSSIVEKDRKWYGVDNHYVGGVYEKQTNRKEAEYVVDLIYENFRKFPERSLGVVTFNIKQQDLVEKLLSKRRQMDPSMEEYFSGERKEPFFIKNLETVQGDERDTIIIDTIYGKDAQGRLRQGFGPIIQDGGERRLNVAVTRAKENVQLVTSMKHTDIQISEDQTGSKGKRLLRAYLDFAERGKVALQEAVTSTGMPEEYESGFEEEVGDFLKENGFEFETQVGVSNYRIDIGLRKPASSDYVLAIECDGATYHSSRNARDRDRLRQEILEGMGWKFYRIWSTDWFRNPKVEKARLLEAAKNALEEKNVISVTQEAEKTETEEEVSFIDFEETIERKQEHFPRYVQYACVGLENLTEEASRISLIEDIVKKESPIAEEWLLKRILPVYSQERVSKAIKTQFEHDLIKCNKDIVVRRDGFLYLKGMTKYSFRVPAATDGRRDIKYIAPEELAVGALVFIQKNVNVDKSGLYSSLVSEQGYKKVTEKMRDALDKVIYMLGAYGLIEIDGESISWKK